MILSAAFIVVLLQAIALASGLVNSRWGSIPSSLRPHPSALHVATVDSQSAVLQADINSVARREYEANLFQAELDDAGLTKCHGILHASGCRSSSDLGRLTADQMRTMGIDSSDSAIISDLADQISSSKGSDVNLCTTVDDGVYPAVKNNFEVICAENEIYKGRLFTIEQCNQLKRMSEYHAYNVNSGWIGMACKSIPGFIPTTDDIFRQLFNELYDLFPGTMREGSVRFESNNEPHLVRYIGEAKGAPLHTDNTHKSITVNVLLSDNDAFGGGGTYLKAIDKTIKLEQGEVLIHPGNLEHAGADITFGVRQLLVAFLECEWEDSEPATSPPPL